MPKGINLANAHRVVKTRRDGAVTIYWYRHRSCGTNFARFHGRNLREAEAYESRAHVTLVRDYDAATAVVASPGLSTLRELVVRYRADPEGLLKLAPGTRRQWQPHLDRICSELGDMPLRALESRRARSALYAWRDQRASTPRTADYGLQVLKRVLSLAKEKGWISENPSRGMKNLYKAGQRAGVVVLPEELEAILEACTERARYPISMLAETGLRRGDVVGLKWDEVHETHLLLNTKKSRGRLSALVALTPTAKAVLARLREERDALLAQGRVPSAYVFTTEKGTPWKGDSISQAFSRAREPLGIDKHLNDLRGTAATRLKVAGVSDEDIAEQLGWSIELVRKIIRHYVDPHLVAQQRLEKLEAAHRLSG